MAYTKQTWDTTSYVNPTRMNHIEDGIKNCDDNMNKVSQTVMGSSTDQYCVLISKSGNASAETNTVRKASVLTLQTNNGHLRISLPHSNTTEVVQPVSIGNDIPVGTEGNTTGSLRIFGKGNAYGQFRDSNGLLTANRTYELPNKSGVLALTNDSDDFVKSLSKGTQTNKNANDMFDIGIYRSNEGGISNCPTNYGVLVILPAYNPLSSSYLTCVQMFYASNGSVYSRINWSASSVSWSTWTQL